MTPILHWNSWCHVCGPVHPFMSELINVLCLMSYVLSVFILFPDLLSSSYPTLLMAPIPHDHGNWVLWHLPGQVTLPNIDPKAYSSLSGQLCLLFERHIQNSFVQSPRHVSLKYKDNPGPGPQPPPLFGSSESVTNTAYCMFKTSKVLPV